mmetsp:Transcript_14591/g.21702  ORF Transcript_14591/g.21702 Transcript_14591/m.21702 type:complete len:145 (-) Transcript_14591:27-461(-)|eukprot:CAMPEP_0171451626 /NCGR_PEP_ID=MMETSP0945-20130129/59_1 /TAXON_ID=109269 /ORGANISM="Vaucheria litorea, Strain CCMP2940" /LENGTH=144 /DNA_ID=CAMNT_0011976131 /DNA_START=67 /DNA_END=501 /DNA_ORIENTATION=-
MVQLTDDLMWGLVKARGGNSFIVKRNGITLTKEPYNVKNVPSRKYTGFTSKGVDVTATENGNSILTLKTKKSGSKPKQGKHVVELRTFGRGPKACQKSAASVLAKSNYPKDLTRATLARISRQAKAGQAKAAGVKYTPKSRSNK